MDDCHFHYIFQWMIDRSPTSAASQNSFSKNIDLNWVFKKGMLGNLIMCEIDVMDEHK
jgi:hypothetical protein